MLHCIAMSTDVQERGERAIRVNRYKEFEALSHLENIYSNSCQIMWKLITIQIHVSFVALFV